MVGHLPIVSLILGAFATLQLVVALVLGLIFGLAGGGMGLVGLNSGEEELMAVAAAYAVMGVFAAVMAALMSVPCYLAAWGVYQRRPWGRILGMVMSAFVCTSFPIGTILGVYSLFVLLDADVGRAFSAPSEDGA